MNADADLFDFVRDLDLPGKDFAIFGSGPIIIRGLIPASNDLDVLCRGRAWERVRALGEMRLLPDYGVWVASLAEGRLTCGREWGIGHFDVEELIETAELIQGLPFVRLEYVIAYKSIRRDPKDMAHLAILAEAGLLAVEDSVGGPQ